MQAHWARLQKHPSADLQFSSSEPKITGYFVKSLSKSARAAGVFGFFIPEYVVSDIDEVKQVLQARGRTDLAYLDNATKEPIEVVFEFKKMKSKLGANASRLAYCKDGMLRFVNAVYARDYDLGFMVGLVETTNDVPDTVAGVQRAIQVPDMRDTLLKTISAPGGKYVMTTAQTFPACDFETRHARDHRGQCDVVIGHFFLPHGT
jgi:hypothetical protein